MIEGDYADIVNSSADRGAGAITAAEFLHRFTGDVPWAHLDIAGTAYDNGSPTRPRAAPAGASACSSSWPEANRPRRT